MTVDVWGTPKAIHNLLNVAKVRELSTDFETVQASKAI